MVGRRLAGWVERGAVGWWLVPLVAAAIAFRHSPRFGLLSDAAFLIEDNLWLRGAGALWANLTHDYFWSSSGNSLPYWRPFTKAAWVLEYAVGGGWPGIFHLVQVALHLLATAAVMWLARELGAARGWSLAAGLWYALHPSLIEPVAMVMARSDLACTVGMIAALAAWLRWRKTGRAGWAAVHAAALLFGLGSKETAVVLAPVLTLVSLLAARRRDELPTSGESERSAVSAGPPSSAGRAGRIGSVGWVVPAWGVTALYFIGRRVVLGSAASPGVDLDPVRILVGGGRYLWGLLPGRIGSAIEPFPRQLSLDPWVLVTALVGLTLFAAAAVFLWRRRGHAWVLALLVPLSLAPVLLVDQLNVPVAASRYAMADRWALPAIAAAAVVLALATTALARRVVVVGVGVVTAVWVVAMLALSGRSHAPYRHTDALAALQDARYLEMPERLRAAEDRCDFVERRMHRSLVDKSPAEALARGREAPGACPNPGRFSLLRLVALTQLGRFAEASETVTRLHGEKLEPRYHAQAAYHAGLAHAELGAFARAESELQQASRLGYRSCNLPAQLGRLLARRNRLGAAAQQFERAAACLRGDPRPLLAAASLWAAAAQPARARELLGRIDPAALSPEVLPGYESLKTQLDRTRR